MMIISATAPENQYVGTPNILPFSRIPRRFP
jgi:hypothetical protein